VLIRAAALLILAMGSMPLIAYARPDHVDLTPTRPSTTSSSRIAGEQPNGLTVTPESPTLTSGRTVRMPVRSPRSNVHAAGPSWHSSVAGH
jgi:hypothetical protein